MQKKISPALIVVALILLVVAAGAITFVINRYRPSKTMADSSQYFGENASDETTIIINGEILEAKGKLINGQVYLTEGQVAQYVNSRFYWDIHAEKMLYTTPYETMEIDGVEKIGDNFYLPITVVESFTDMKVESFTEPDRTVIFTRTAIFREARVIKDGAVRVKGGIKSDILRTVAADADTILVLEELDTWSKVLTLDGFTGYIEKENIEEVGDFALPEIKGENEFTSILREHKINLAWHQVTSNGANDTLIDMTKDAQGLNVVSPTWFSITDAEGNISSFASAEYVQQAHAQGLEVWGLIDNFNPDFKTFDVLSYTDKRTKIIDQLIDIAKEVGLDGLNIDFESITEETGPHFVQFLREIGVRCRAENLVLSVDNPVPLPYNRHYNFKEQGVVVDYVIIMGYDEHYKGSEEAGSVASLGFVRAGIEETLKDVPKEKVINGIPFYTRVWREPFGSSNITSEILGMNGADAYIAEHNMTTHWDANVGQTVAEVEDDEALYRIWVEDEQSIEQKMILISEHDLAGVAAWKLGFERSSVWPIIEKHLN